MVSRENELLKARLNEVSSEKQALEAKLSEMQRVMIEHFSKCPLFKEASADENTKIISISPLN